MAVDLDSGTGLFDRLGKIGNVLNVLNAAIGTTLPVDVNELLVKFDGGTNSERACVDDLLDGLVALGSAPDSFRAELRSAAEQTLLTMVDEDNPLSERTVDEALRELVRQMLAASESVDASAVTATWAVDGARSGAITGATQANPVVITSNAHGLANGDVVQLSGLGGSTQLNGVRAIVSAATTNTFALNVDGSAHSAYTSGGRWVANYGNPEVIVSVVTGDGKTAENALAEDVVLEVTVATSANSETLTAKGEDADTTDKLRHDWPGGSGASVTTQTRDPASAGYLLNGDFEDFATTNTPDSWTVSVGTVGTHILESTSKYAGSKCLRLVGDGSTLVALTQALSVSALTSKTPYPVCLRTAVSSVPAAGVLVVDLYDGSAVIEDDAGNANSLSIDLTAERTTYQPHTAVFRLPEPKPSAVTLRLRMSTALSNTVSVFVDDLIVGPAMTQLYDGGPYLSVIAGSTRLAVGDRFVVTVTNDRAGAFQTLFDRLFQQPSILLPSNAAGGETISDGLIS